MAFHAQWRPVRGRLPWEDYRSISRQNLRVVRGAIEDTIASLGAPVAATAVLGALVGFAVDDTRIGLNRSKTLVLQFEDTSGSERSVFINVELAW